MQYVDVDDDDAIYGDISVKLTACAASLPGGGGNAVNDRVYSFQVLKVASYDRGNCSLAVVIDRGMVADLRADSSACGGWGHPPYKTILFQCLENYSNGNLC
jgi:hypothetical protein